MKRLKDILREAASKMEEHHFMYPRRQAQELFCDLLEVTLPQLYDMLDQPLSDVQCLKAKDWLEKRIAGQPLAYLRGEVEFYGCRILVNSHVLIPRPETELLVDRIVRFLKPLDLKGKVLWDICSGSGCIGIAIKKALPDLQISLVDISKEAVALSLENARLNEVQVNCLQGDLFAPFGKQKADYIVSNPPYLSLDEYRAVDDSVKNFEPQLALLGGENGLVFYDRFAKEFPSHLMSKGCAWMEIGFLQGPALEKLFSFPCFVNKKLEKDFAGHDRFFFLEME